MQIFANILVAFLVIDALLLILFVLMQRPKNEGLGAAFGGGVTENIFGAQTTDVLVKITSYLGVFFFVLAMGLAALNARMHSPKSEIQQQLLTEPAPGETATGTPAPSPLAEEAAKPLATPGTGGSAPEAGSSAESTSSIPGPAPVEGAPSSTTGSHAN